MNLNPMTNPAVLSVGLPIVMLAALLIGAAVALGQRRAEARRHHKRIEATLAGAHVDEMTNKTFRLYVMSVLAQQGFETQIPPQHDDLGTELLGRRADQRCTIEVVHYTKPLTPQSVRMAVDNRLRLGYDEAMVITNTTFSDAARRLAAAEHCTLIDRNGLAEWILQAQANRSHLGRRAH